MIKETDNIQEQDPKLEIDLKTSETTSVEEDNATNEQGVDQGAQELNEIIPSAGQAISQTESSSQNETPLSEASINSIIPSSLSISPLEMQGAIEETELEYRRLNDSDQPIFDSNILLTNSIDITRSLPTVVPPVRITPPTIPEEDTVS